MQETETPVTESDNMMSSVLAQLSPTTDATLPITQQQPNSSASGQTLQSGMCLLYSLPSLLVL